MENNLIAIAKITKPHGIMGNAKVMSYAAVPADIFQYPYLYDKDMNKYTLTKRSGADNFFIVKLNQNNSRNLIEELAGSLLYITRDMLAGAAEDEYYHNDLVGLKVLTEEGKDYGEVVAVNNFGAGDILEVSVPNEKNTMSLPFIAEFVTEVNLEKKYLCFNFTSSGILA